jgi:hypothetical protein
MIGVPAFGVNLLDCKMQLGGLLVLEKYTGRWTETASTRYNSYGSARTLRRCLSRTVRPQPKPHSPRPALGCRHTHRCSAARQIRPRNYFRRHTLWWPVLRVVVHLLFIHLFSCLSVTVSCVRFTACFFVQLAGVCCVCGPCPPNHKPHSRSISASHTCRYQ